MFTYLGIIHPMENEPKSQECPICAGETSYNPRYPYHICRTCLADGIVVNGCTVEVSSLDIYSVPSVECLVKGKECIAQEARFGGLVVNLKH